MKPKTAWIKRELLSGVVCQICKERTAIDYWRGAFICDECLNPPPSTDYYVEELQRYYYPKSSGAYLKEEP